MVWAGLNIIGYIIKCIDDICVHEILKSWTQIVLCIFGVTQIRSLAKATIIPVPFFTSLLIIFSNLISQSSLFD